MRLGVFGGSFDPPHVGHVLAVLDAAEQLGLDRVLWIPSGRQPLKAPNPSGGSPAQRMRMVSAAVRGIPIFEANGIEIDRGGLSYTVATAEALAHQFPFHERVFLVGEDAWRNFGRWHQPERIRTFVQIAVMTRPGATLGEGGETHAIGNASLGVNADYYLSTRLVDVSSTEIRARVNAGKPVRGFVHDEVAALIESEGLYRW